MEESEEPTKFKSLESILRESFEGQEGADQGVLDILVKYVEDGSLEKRLTDRKRENIANELIRYVISTEDPS